MAVHFTQKQWEKIRKTYGLWWEGKLERPLIKILIEDGFNPEGAPPQAPFLSQQNCTDFSWSPDELVEAMDYQLSQYEYLGDAFPVIPFDTFGPGVLAAFCGAKLDNSSGGVWFFPEKEQEISDIHPVYDPENIWVKRIKSIYTAGHKKWNGNVLMTMPDLGGVLDVAATFRGTEHLLYDLYDEPEEVKRLCSEIETAWMEAYNDLNSVLQPLNPGYSDWLRIYSDRESYILQSDFSYMLSTPMFAEFTLPSIKNACDQLENTIYHLDGIGQIKHLDHLLALEKLDGIQWVPGDGQPSTGNWIPVYGKIAAAGKRMDIQGTFDDFEKIYHEVPLGTCPGIHTEHHFSRSQRAQALELLKKYGIESN